MKTQKIKRITLFFLIAVVWGGLINLAAYLSKMFFVKNISVNQIDSDNPYALLHLQPTIDTLISIIGVFGLIIIIYLAIKPYLINKNK